MLSVSDNLLRFTTDMNVLAFAFAHVAKVESIFSVSAQPSVNWITETILFLFGWEVYTSSKGTVLTVPPVAVSLVLNALSPKAFATALK